MNNTKKSLKSSNGITLIALVITIIVLLILAGISISMLSGDNSILQKATDAKQTSERAEAKEQAQIDIMAWITDKTANHQDSSLDDNKIKEILTDKSYVKEAKATSFITKKGEYEIPYSELYTKNLVSTTEINYGSKTAQTVAEGDDITIGTERFKVLKNDGTTIQAIPYYNITLTDEPVQSPDAGTIYFGDIYGDNFLGDYISVNMSGENIAVQKYIIAYQKHFQKLGLTNISTRIIDFNNDSFSENINFNPSQTGKYWIGTQWNMGENAYILVVLENGDVSEEYTSFDSGVGVRPLIEISF